MRVINLAPFGTLISTTGNIALEFDQPIAAAAKQKIVLFELDSDDNQLGFIDHSLSFSNNTLYLDPIPELKPETKYQIRFNSEAITAKNGDIFPPNEIDNNYPATEFSLTTAKQGETPSSDLDVSVDNNDSISPSQDISYTFTEAIANVNPKKIILYELDSDGIIDHRIKTEISFSKNKLLINPSQDLKEAAKYELTFNQGAIKSVSNKPYPPERYYSSTKRIEVSKTSLKTIPEEGDSPAKLDQEDSKIIPLLTITTSTIAVREGELLTTTFGSSKNTANKAFYWSITGENIDESDFASGSLKGIGLIDGNGKFGIAHILSEDTRKEGDERIYISAFSDPTRTRLLCDPVQVLVIDSSTIKRKDRMYRTFNNQVADFIIGSSQADRLTARDNQIATSFWGEGGADTIIGGTKDDYLVGGDGIDILTGGKGSDTFVMNDFSQKNYDIIKDFLAKDDVIAISSNLIDASSDDTIGLIRYQDISNKAIAEKFFKSKGLDHYIVVDTAPNISKINCSSFSEKILLAVDLTNKCVRYDTDGTWNKGSDILCKFTGKLSFDSWSSDNFMFGLDLT